MSENINNTKDEDSIFPPELTSSIERLTYGPQDTESQRTVLNHLEKLKEFQEDTNNSVRSRKSLRRINTWVWPKTRLIGMAKTIQDRKMG